jgi:hypothetical protein
MRGTAPRIARTIEAYPELSRWQAAIDARPAFAVAIGTKPGAEPGRMMEGM